MVNIVAALQQMIVNKMINKDHFYLYSPIYGKCAVLLITDGGDILVSFDNKNVTKFDKYGRLYINNSNEVHGDCMIFPSQFYKDWDEITKYYNGQKLQTFVQMSDDIDVNVNYVVDSFNSEELSEIKVSDAYTEICLPRRNEVTKVSLNNRISMVSINEQLIKL